MQRYNRDVVDNLFSEYLNKFITDNSTVQRAVSGWSKYVVLTVSDGEKLIKREIMQIFTAGRVEMKDVCM